MNKTSICRSLAAGIGMVGLLASPLAAWAQQVPAEHGAPTPWTPNSNRQSPSDVGQRAHTNIVALSLPDIGNKRANPQGAPYSGYFYETPSSLACVYGLIAQTTGCNPNTATAIPTSSSPLAIAIVDAYDNPDATSDLTAFSSQFGLPVPTSSNFQVVYASGRRPAADTGWALESSLDIEWAHAMSPTAKIYLVEAASASNADLLAAVDTASNLVSAAGGGLVSMSWGSSEFSTESSYDTHFQKLGVTYLASSGDAPGVIWPSVSQYVIAAGGTSISRNPTTGNYQSEGTWQQAGSGISAYIARPTYQSSLSSIIGSKRGVPDLAAIADPDTGVWVYSGLNGGWWIVGGTSVASPVLAGVMSWKGTKASTVQGTLTAIYGSSYGTFRDIIIGNCGPYAGWIAGTGWDLCSGYGSILGGNRTSVVSGSIAP